MRNDGKQSDEFHRWQFNLIEDNKERIADWILNWAETEVLDKIATIAISLYNQPDKAGSVNKL